MKRLSTQQTSVKRKAVCGLAAKRLVDKALQVRKEHAGLLLKTIRTIQSMQIKELKISMRVVIQLQLNHTFMIQVTCM